MGRSEPDADADATVRAIQQPPLTSRRHIDLLRVCSAASSLRRA
ncbi:hypothetical protein [Streptomyces albiaxialis]